MGLFETSPTKAVANSSFVMSDSDSDGSLTVSENLEDEDFHSAFRNQNFELKGKSPESKRAIKSAQRRSATAHGKAVFKE